MTIKYSSRAIRTLLILLMVGYAIFFSIQLILHYYSFGSRALDLGNMGQAIWNTAHGRLFHQTNQPGLTNRLSLHVEPILIPVSLLYYIYSGPEILFIFQTIVVALGALPVFALAHLKLKSESLALIFALVYLMLPAIQGATLLDFHAVTLAPTFLLATFYYLETKRPKPFTLFAILAVSTKEEISLIIMMIGFYAFFINRQRRLGLITVVTSLGWAFLAVFVIPPIFASTGNLHWGRYSHLGDSPANIIMNMFGQPNLFLAHLQQVNALEYLRLLLTPTAFVALLSPLTLLLALPSLGINLLSNFPPMQEVNSLIYAAPIVPALIISSIYGVANLKRSIEGLEQRIGEWRMANSKQRVAGGQVGESANHTTTTHHATNNPKDAQPTHISHPIPLFNLLLGSLILVATLIYQADYGYLPGGGQFRGWEEVTDHHRRAERIFAQIPSKAALSAQDRLNPHVSQRQTLYIFDRVDDADHILLDITLDSWPLHPVELRHQVDEFLRDGFGVVDAFDGYLLLAKNRPDLPKTLPGPFFDFARVPTSNPDNFSPQFPTAVTFDNKLQLLGYSFHLGAHEQFLPVITLYWRALEPLDQDYTLWPFFINRNGQLIEDTSERPVVTTLWYPTSRWSPDEIIMTSTLPFDLAPNLGDEFTLAVGVATEGNWADPDQRLPILHADTNLYTFENNTWARLGTFQRTGRKTYHLLPDTVTPAQEPRQVQFWNVINLQGVDLPQTSLKPGDSLPFTLHWQSVAPLTIDLTTFAHLMDDQGNTIAQLDWTPQDSVGYLPTTAWQPERPVIDSQSILLPPDAPPGQYRLVIGWYYPPTGERLPLTASDIPGENGNVTNAGVVTIQ